MKELTLADLKRMVTPRKPPKRILTGAAAKLSNRVPVARSADGRRRYKRKGWKRTNLGMKWKCKRSPELDEMYRRRVENLKSRSGKPKFSEAWGDEWLPTGAHGWRVRSGRTTARNG